VLAISKKKSILSKTGRMITRLKEMESTKCSSKLTRERKKQTLYLGTTVDPVLGPKHFLITATVPSSAIITITTSIRALATGDISRQSKTVHKSTYLISDSSDGRLNPSNLLFSKMGQQKKNRIIRLGSYLKMWVLQTEIPTKV